MSGKKAIFRGQIMDKEEVLKMEASLSASKRQATLKEDKPKPVSKARNVKKKQQVEKPVVEETVKPESEIIDIDFDLGDDL